MLDARGPVVGSGGEGRWPLFVSWSDVFAVGIPKVDDEHRRRVGIVDAFHQVHRSGAGREPGLGGLPEGLSEAEFQRRFGGVGALAYQELAAGSERPLVALPLYR